MKTTHTAMAGSMPHVDWLQLPETERHEVVARACFELEAAGELVRADRDGNVWQYAVGYAEQALRAFHARWLRARTLPILMPRPLTTAEVADLVRRARLERPESAARPACRTRTATKPAARFLAMRARSARR